jgi:lipoyl(octanoyl) transferase
MSSLLNIQALGLMDYLKTQHSMQDFTDQRDETTFDECWFLEHHPVFTLGQAGKEEHILNAHDIPVVRSDRGGQVTYHGPGQLVVYFMWDLARLGLNTRQFVMLLENVLIETCQHYGLDCYGDRDAPGVYCHGAKIASIGLRVRKHRTYHGIALNVCNDLAPFQYINPCGYANQKMISLSMVDKQIGIKEVEGTIKKIILKKYNTLK